MKATIENVISYTNARLESWYQSVNEEYGINGSGYSKYNSKTQEFEIYYTENSVKYCFKHYWHEDFKINTIFDIWQSDADLENDLVK